MQISRVSHLTRSTFNVRSLCVVITFAISGCSTPKYKEPTDQSVATIDFMNETPVPMVVYFHADATECTDRTSAGLIQPETHKAFRVSTDKELVFTVAVNLQSERDKKIAGLGALGGALGALAVIAVTNPAVEKMKKECIPTIDFLPEAGRSYEFQLNSDGNDCSYKFNAKTTENQQTNEVGSVAFTNREWIRPMGESGPFCKKK